MRADRLLAILLLLQTRGRATARELAEALEVSERTVLRDMEALERAGVPLVSHRGAGGGWELLEGYRTDLTGLTETESQALFVGAPSKLLHDLRLDRASDAALLKLLGALPPVQRPGAEYARQRIHIDLAGWKSARDPVPLLPLLQDAVFRERKVRLEHTHGERVVEPLGLVAKGSTWYLIAATPELRTYRGSRLTRVEPLDEPVTRPADFDLATFWQESMRTFQERLPRYDVVARIDPSVLRRVEVFLRYGAIDETCDDGQVKLHFDSIDAAVASLMVEGVEVLEPEELRTEIVRIARKLISASS